MALQVYHQYKLEMLRISISKNPDIKILVSNFFSKLAFIPPSRIGHANIATEIYKDKPHYK